MIDSGEDETNTTAITDQECRSIPNATTQGSQEQQSHQTGDHANEDVSVGGHLGNFANARIVPRRKSNMSLSSPTEPEDSSTAHQAASTTRSGSHELLASSLPFLQKQEHSMGKNSGVRETEDGSGSGAQSKLRAQREPVPSVVIAGTGTPREDEGRRIIKSHRANDPQAYSSGSEASEVYVATPRSRRGQQGPDNSYHTASHVVRTYKPTSWPRRQSLPHERHSDPPTSYRIHSPSPSSYRVSRTHDPIPSRPANPPPVFLDPVVDDVQYFCSIAGCPESIDQGGYGYKHSTKCWDHICNRHNEEGWVVVLRRSKAKEAAPSNGHLAHEGLPGDPLFGAHVSGNGLEKSRMPERRHRKRDRHVRFAEESEASSVSTKHQHLKGKVQSSAKTDIGSNSSNDNPKESRITSCDYTLCRRSLGSEFTRNEFLEHLKVKHGEKPPDQWSLDLVTMYWEASGRREFGKGSKRRCTNCLRKIPSGACKCKWPA